MECKFEDQSCAEVSTCFTDSDCEHLSESSARGLSSQKVGKMNALVLEGLVGWKSHALEVAHLSGDEPLRTFGMAAFQHSGLVSRFQLDYAKLDQFLTEVESGYRTDVP